MRKPKKPVSWPHKRPDWNDNMCLRSSDWIGLVLRVPGAIFTGGCGADDHFSLKQPLNWRNDPNGWEEFKDAVERYLLACDLTDVHVLGFERSKEWLDILICPEKDK